jgi:hypothetical protein
VPIWAIVLIAIAVLIIIFRKRLSSAVKKAAPGLGLRNAVESVPVYGQIVKGGRTILTPLHKLNNKFSDYTTKALEHIPIAGKYIAIPHKIVTGAVYKVTDYFGLN